MCLYGKLVKNPKYKKTKKNGGIIPPISDYRVSVVPIGCGNCIECKKQKAREWQVRLLEDVREYTNGKFITLTFSNESIKKLTEQKPTKYWKSLKGLEGYELDNELATRAVRLWLERWRKIEKISIRHWLITELGHEGTENIHIHGIVWTDKPEQIRSTWDYGWIWPRNKEGWNKNWVNEQTINYIIKYITKIDKNHETFKGKILTSPGIGKGYTKRYDSTQNTFKKDKTNECYITRNGYRMGMPAYWRNKIYTDDEREKLWIEKLNKNIRYVMGEKIDISKGETEYYKILKWYQNRNTEMGYGNDKSNNWEKKEYEKQRRNMLTQERINKTNNNNNKTS